MTDKSEDYWYEHRHELKYGMVFRDYEGSLVRLNRRVPGDGTDWYADVWYSDRPDVPVYESRPDGPWYEKGHWSCDDYRLHPSDLRGDPLPSPNAQPE